MQEQVVLITGATGALGGATARGFAQAGARLALTGRNAQALGALESSLNLAPERTLAHPADLGDAAQANALVGAILARWGRLDALINTTGGWRGGVSIAELTDAQWEAIMVMNLLTAFHISRAVLPPMVAQGSGRIVHIGSRSVEQARAGQAAYNVSKSGLVALTRSLAVEYGPAGIRANALLPGTIDTEANRRSRPDADTSGWTPPEALVRVMLLLCGPAGAAINGASIPFGD